MYLLYSLLFTLGILLLSPRFILDAFTHGKYVEGLRERLGRLPLIPTEGSPVIWLHCVSVGETQAARPLARLILEKFPRHKLVVSTVTRTGQRVAREVFRDEAAAVIYFPFDWAWTVRRALRRVNPEIVLVMETELWPRFLLECSRRKVPVALVNGRLSEKSFRRYRLIGSFIKRVVGCLDLALMQSEADAARIRELGLEDRRVEVSGNVKFDLLSSTDEYALTESLRERFGLSETGPLVVAASTHSPEERVTLEAFRMLRATQEGLGARLLLAPRHPERFEEVASLLASSGLSWSRRSLPARPDDKTSDVILLDSIGELRAVYPLARLVFVGGSIAETGGHNVLEPAASGACIITGAHTSNFTAIVNTFLERDALVQLPPLMEEEAPAELARVMSELLSDEARRHRMIERAKEVLDENRGATLYTADRIKELAESRDARRMKATLP
ncbi:MAG TPA: 3-deoxy-D-manno-octulosonic acid transferase [Pyrinomonadaceae bacterium]|nr:3-deoxy-D-manno-octulosonic acid transferase [Pyrinomonadaceae bacterium]